MIEYLLGNIAGLGIALVVIYFWMKRDNKKEYEEWIRKTNDF